MLERWHDQNPHVVGKQLEITQQMCHSFAVIVGSLEFAETELLEGG